MENPITLQIKDLKESIVANINESRLAPFILDSIFKDLYSEIHALVMKQEEQDLQDYKKEWESKNAEIADSTEATK